MALADERERDRQGLLAIGELEHDRSSSASRSAPVNRFVPSIASRVSTAIWLPTLR